MVSYLGRDNTARSLAQTVSVFGLSFGSNDFTPSARKDTVVCATASWVSSTSVNCFDGSSLPATISIEVTVAGLAGTRYPQFTFDGFVLLVLLSSHLEFLECETPSWVCSSGC